MFEKDIFIDYIGIPVVNVTYSAIWTSAEIVTSTCSNNLITIGQRQGSVRGDTLGKLPAIEYQVYSHVYIFSVCL